MKFLCYFCSEEILNIKSSSNHHHADASGGGTERVFFTRTNTPIRTHTYEHTHTNTHIHAHMTKKIVSLEGIYSCNVLHTDFEKYQVSSIHGPSPESSMSPKSRNRITVTTHSVGRDVVWFLFLSFPGGLKTIQTGARENFVRKGPHLHV